MLDEFKIVQMAPAPRFTASTNGPALATIYASHYDRLIALADAVRTKNTRLIRLALNDIDKWGSRDEPR